MERIFSLTEGGDFEELTLEVFRFQYDKNAVYRDFCKALGCNPEKVTCLEEIPFLPIELFKNKRVVSFDGEAAHVFVSSGTTGNDPSKHYVADTMVYEQSFLECFRLFYGPPADYCMLALLPGYNGPQNASLVYMANRLIEESGHPHSGFYLHDLEGLSEKIRLMVDRGDRILLLGVSFALLDLAGFFSMPLKNTIVMETGGMKGRRREMVREELHQLLCQAFQQEAIHSEYGMTELFSQAYSKGMGLFSCPPWMRVLIREDNDPLELIGYRRGGGINVIDLANLYSCSFIATQDLGRVHPGGQFEVLGRFDNSDVRGCNLLVD